MKKMPRPGQLPPTLTISASHNPTHSRIPVFSYITISWIKVLWDQKFLEWDSEQVLSLCSHLLLGLPGLGGDSHGEKSEKAEMVG